MSKQKIQSKIGQIITDKFGEHILSVNEALGETIVTVKEESKDILLDIGRFLRDDEQLNFDFLCFVTGVDCRGYDGYAEHNCNFEVVYQFFSVTGGHHLRLKVPVGEVNGKFMVNSITSIWMSARFHENEVYDMFGIEFRGHPEPRRFYMPEDWEGHPLRKDYDLRCGQDYGIKKMQEKTIN